MVRNPDDRRLPSRADEPHKSLDSQPRGGLAAPLRGVQTGLLRFDADHPAPIFVSDGEKGGVGKSHFKRTIAYVLSMRAIQWRGFDMDPSNHHLVRFHSKHDVEELNWQQPSDWEVLYEGIMQTDKSSVILIDLPSQCRPVMEREYPRLLRTAKHQGRPVFRFWTMSFGFDSVNLLLDSLAAVECSNTFAVLNMRDAKRGDFSLWDDSGTRRALLSGGGLEFCMPSLPGAVAKKIEAKDLSFLEALSCIEEPWLLCDLEGYLATVHEEFAELFERIS